MGSTGMPHLPGKPISFSKRPPMDSTFGMVFQLIWFVVKAPERSSQLLKLWVSTRGNSDGDP